jgi:dipeptidyl aminopeptidase/acylaminoacyl peptidase
MNRERLTGSWGVFDVNEAVEVLYQLGKRSLIDPKRACIRGTSAGGFTALATLSTKPGTFAAGVSFCGASDLVKLQSGMPKLMCHMLEGLIGGSLGEIPHLWKARSPLNNTANIKVPLLVRSIRCWISPGCSYWIQ